VLTERLQKFNLRGLMGCVEIAVVADAVVEHGGSFNS